jgi:hypothetical protein
MAWDKIGTIMKGKKGNYLKITKTVTLKEGQNLQIFDPRKSKFMTEERLAKLPEYVRAEVFLTPEDGGKKEEAVE